MTLSPTSSRFTQSQADALYLAAALADAKGDLLAATAADTFARLAVGSDGAFLQAASAQASGLAYAVSLTELFDSTLGADAASIDTGASGIAQTADHLLVIIIARTSQAAVQSSVNVTINADGGANYDRQEVLAADTTVSGASSLAQTSWFAPAPGASAHAGAAASAFLLIPGYRQTTFHKTAVGVLGFNEDTAADNRIKAHSLRWRSTAAISRMAVAAGSGNLLAGSRLAVYGIG